MKGLIFPTLLFVLILPCLQAFQGPKFSVHLYDFSSKLISYQKALNWQEKLVKFHQDKQQLFSPLEGNLDNSEGERKLVGSLLALQHKSVYTLGTGTNSNSGPFHTLDLDGNPLIYETFPVNRAGQATYHGPGQLILYPIIDLVSLATHLLLTINYFILFLLRIILGMICIYT